MKEAKQVNRLPIVRWTMLFICVLLSFGSLFAQSKTITGLVKDPTGDVVIGASVTVKATKIATITGIDGKFRINVPADAKTIVVSYVGMVTQEVAIKSNTLNVVLQNSDKSLEEVVVVGYGTVKKKDLTGSVASVSQKQMKDIPVATAAEALTGKLTGVQVTTTEGSPDADIKIRVRGGGSITQSNTPLYIVDGFAKDDIKDIAPSDIVSIDVLKDASSTAIYGTRGANGVILITTRSADKGKLSVAYSGYTGVKNISKKLSVLKPYQFAQKQYERAVLANTVPGDYENYFGSYSDINLYKYMNGTDWQEETFGRTGYVQNHSLAVNGGNKKFMYNLGASYIYDKAIMYRSDYNRQNYSLKLKYNPVKWLKFDFSARYALTDVNGSGANDQTGTEKSTSDSRVKSALVYSPIDLKNMASQSDDADAVASLYSPLTTTLDNDRIQKSKNLSLNGGFTIAFSKALTFNSTYGYTSDKKNDKRYYGLTSYYVREGGALKGSDGYTAPATFITDYNKGTFQNTNVLNFRKEDIIKGHNLSVVLGQENLIRKYDYYTKDYEKFPRTYNSSSVWANLSQGYVRPTLPFTYPDYRLFSYFGRVNYDYLGRYLLAATFRADGSSKFSNGNQWGYFPSFSVGWRISEEPFMKFASEWLSNLKLRGGYGQSGNDNIDVSAFIRSYSAASSTYLDTSVFPSYYYSAGTTLANADLKWETTITRNAGLDFGFFDGRINGALELYSNKTQDALMKVTLGGVGYTDQWQNAASTQNRGVELSLNTELIKTKDFSLNFSVNISKNENKVLALKNGVQATFNEGWTSMTEASNSYIVSVGKPVGLIYGYVNDGWYKADDFKWNGAKWVMNPDKYTYDATSKTYKDSKGNAFVDNSSIAGLSWGPGAMKLKDQDGDGVITTSDKTVIGNANPKHYGAFSFTATYKGFDATANFNWVYGNKIYNATKIEVNSAYYKYRNMLSGNGVSYTQVDWSTGNRVTDVSALESMNSDATIWAAPTGKYATTSWAIEDGSFLRFSTLTVGYTIPKKLLKKVHIDNLRLYATGYNLYTWTKYSGYDPEVDTRRSSPATPGVDYSAYPKSRSYNIGINITF